MDCSRRGQCTVKGRGDATSSEGDATAGIQVKGWGGGDATAGIQVKGWGGGNATAGIQVKGWGGGDATSSEGDAREGLTALLQHAIKSVKRVPKKDPHPNSPATGNSTDM